jgi:hypothetical protein
LCMFETDVNLIVNYQTPLLLFTLNYTRAASMLLECRARHECTVWSAFGKTVIVRLPSFCSVSIKALHRAQMGSSCWDRHKQGPVWQASHAFHDSKLTCMLFVSSARQEHGRLLPDRRPLGLYREHCQQKIKAIGPSVNELIMFRFLYSWCSR